MACFEDGGESQVVFTTTFLSGTRTTKTSAATAPPSPFPLKSLKDVPVCLSGFPLSSCNRTLATGNCRSRPFVCSAFVLSLPVWPDLAKFCHFGNIFCKCWAIFGRPIEYFSKFWTCYDKFCLPWVKCSMMQMAEYWIKILSLGHTGRLLSAQTCEWGKSVKDSSRNWVFV